MAACFGGPVSDVKEVSLRAEAIPNNKSTTDWGIRVWNVWSTNRAMTVADVHIYAAGGLGLCLCGIGLRRVGDIAPRERLTVVLNLADIP